MFRLSLIPKEKKFFALFEQGTQNAVKIAQRLRDMVSVWENMKERAGVINGLEHQGMRLSIKFLTSYTGP